MPSIRRFNHGSPSVVPPEVVHIFGVMDVGGAELRTIELQEAMPAHSFTYVTLSGRRGALAERIEEANGVVRPMSLTALFPIRFYRLLRKTRPIVVDSHVATFSGAILLLAALARVPCRVAHFHSDGDGHEGTLRRRIQRTLMRMLISRFATAIVGVSPSALSLGYSQRWGADPRCLVVPNGTAVDQLWANPARPIRNDLKISASDLLVMHVGRPSPEKNRERLPGIIDALRRIGCPAHLVLVGPRDPEDDDRVLKAAKRHSVADRVHFVGETSDVGAMMRSADVVVLPSLREGLPGVVIEAVATGTPVVASDCGGVLWLAERLPLIECLSLSAHDVRWASGIANAAALGSVAREAGPASIGRAGFDIGAASKAHECIYSKRGSKQ